MDRSRWLTAVVCVAGSIGVAWGLNFFFESLMAERYPARLAYAPVADMPPPVDLASVQRGWPNGGLEPAERVRLAAYMRSMERQTPRIVTPADGGQAPAPVDLGTLLASADANAGKSKVQACVSCHTFDQGGPNRIGPNLWGVIGRDIASHQGFAYSPAMSAQAGAWTYVRLFDYLASPARDIPGNKMGYAGMRRPEDRASVIRYLATLGSNPPPLPQPESPDKPGKAEQ